MLSRFGIAMISGALGSGLTFAVMMALPSGSPTTSLDAPYEKARQSYQLSLNYASNRTSNIMVSVRGDQMAVSLEKGGGLRPGCTSRCATATLVNGGVNLTLPVGFTAEDHTYRVSKTTAKVVKLTYWNPITHRSQTDADNLGVALPNVLRQRSVESLSSGESGFVSVYEITQAKSGTLVYIGSQLLTERPDPLYDTGDPAVVPISRNGNGQLQACLPPGHALPIYNERMWPRPNLYALVERKC